MNAAMKIARTGGLLSLLLSGFAIAATVPAQYQDLYATLNSAISRFDSTVSSQWNGASYPVLYSAGVSTANGNRGKQLLPPATLAGVNLELDRLRSLGLKAVVLSVGFPILFEPFHQWNEGNAAQGTANYQTLLAFYKQVAAEVRARGMKLVVEGGVLFPGTFSSGSGLDVSAYYPLLGNAQYFYGRAQNIVTIARELQPDYLSIGSEPDSEQLLTGKPVGTPAAYTGLINYILSQLSAAGVSGIPIGAGTGSWDPQAAAYVTAFATQTNLAYIDLHVYPVNFNYLDALLSLSDLAHASGKEVAISEAWSLKARDSELQSGISPGTDPTIFARDPYSFWEPIDQQFLRAMSRFAQFKRLRFFSAFWEKYLFAYLDYDQVQAMVPAPDAAAVIELASAAAADAIVNNRVSGTGLFYRSLIGSSLVDVIEYYHASFDHYFITWAPGEISMLDAGIQIRGWARTGLSFRADTGAPAGASDICRFYIPPSQGDSHFFGRGTAECAATAAAHPGFVLEDPKFMRMFLPSAGICPVNTTPVYRVFSNRSDANHRYMTDRALRDQMVARGWLAEGDGPDRVVMCAPT